MEITGVLKSWAIPKGPSLNPKERRLAIAVEDHARDYIDFEGIIPKGTYGAGAVLVWDRGTYQERGDKNIEKQYKEGQMKFTLTGKKLKGDFLLLQTKMGGQQKNWLLIKEKDAFASTENILKKDNSVKSGKKIKDLEDE